MKPDALVLAVLLIASLAACAPRPGMPPAGAGSRTVAITTAIPPVSPPVAPATTTSRTAPAPSATNPGSAPAKRASQPINDLAMEVDYTCTTDADCTVKNVGNCCGAYPACVNTNSKTFPDRVRAQCAKEHRMAVCGFPSISGCACVQGKCSGINGPSNGGGAR
jgi:hypothetical protein